MKADSPSKTAEAASAVRALESLLPEGKRLFKDVYSAKFLSPLNRLILGLCSASPWVRNVMEKELDRRYPGVPADFICRTRYIDRLIQEAVGAGGLERLVILGAGYDPRGLRFSLEANTGTSALKVFELDHPATQARKSKIAAKLFKKDVLNRISWISHDLNRSPDESAQLREAFAKPAQSFWIAEGLLSYLPQTAVRGLFAWIAKHSQPGSRITFTYVHRDLVERRSNSPSAQAILQYLDKAGESFVAGWTPEEMARDCLDAGIVVEDDRSEEDLANQYLKPIGRALSTVNEFRIVSARIS